VVGGQDVNHVGGYSTVGQGPRSRPGHRLRNDWAYPVRHGLHVGESGDA
jgi:hypothetical protein